MKSIDTLVEDIYDLFRSGEAISRLSDGNLVRDFAEKLSTKISQSLTEEYRPRARLSNVGKPCLRQLWYEINVPSRLEPVSPQARIKFIFGHILEELLLFLAKAAGHEVTDEQKEVSLGGVLGHIDGRIDGHLVDCKSASPYGFDKFERHLSPSSDAFGYLPQLSLYGNALGEDQGSFLAIHKVLGDIVLDTHFINPAFNEDYIQHVTTVLSKSEPPKRAFTDEPEGKSGNRKLGVNCSYCPAKKLCWPGVRGFAYANGPVYLTVVEREPREHVKEFAL